MRRGTNRNQCGITEYASVFVTWKAPPEYLTKPAFYNFDQKLLGKSTLKCKFD